MGGKQSEIVHDTTASFAKFDSTFSKGLAAYEKAISKTGADTATVNATFETKVSDAFTKLDASLLAISRNLPYGGVNLDPVLADRATGSTGVTDTTTGLVTPSLETDLEADFAAGDVSGAEASIHSTLTLVRSDIDDYTNLGVTNGYFKLGGGAKLPAIS